MAQEKASGVQEDYRRSDVVAEQEAEVRSRCLEDVLQVELVMGPVSKDGMTLKAQGKHHVFRDGCDCARSSNVKVVEFGLIVC